MQQHNAQSNSFTDEKALLGDILLALDDYFNCTAVQTGNAALLRLAGGQAFKIVIERAD